MEPGPGALQRSEAGFPLRELAIPQLENAFSARTCDSPLRVALLIDVAPIRSVGCRGSWPVGMTALRNRRLSSLSSEGVGSCARRGARRGVR